MLSGLFPLGEDRAASFLAGERIGEEATVVQRIVGFFCLAGGLAIGHLAFAQEFSADVHDMKRENKG